MAGITSVPVLAASNGIYTATATSHYRHPTTGVIEDSGGEGSAVLGQSMTDSALNKSALVEVDANGNTWVTLLLADTVGRTIAAPYEISASVIMSVVGGPFFIILLRRSRQSYGQ